MTNNSPKNSLAPQNKAAVRFSNFITGEVVRRKINNMIGGKDGQRFITSIVSAVSNNPALQECEHGTILSSAMLGESLGLSPSAQLGQFYIVPFKDRKNNRTVATFQLGYKGYIQLAIRSGQYKKLNVVAIKEGELKHYDPLYEELEVELIQDESKREEASTIGYYAMFEYLNGFRKTLYWSRKKMESHALKYSQGYAKDKKKGWSYSFWSKDFDAMAFKTMLRQIISKWGIMSIEMQQAISGDNAVITDDGPKVVDVDVSPTTTVQDDFFSDTSELTAKASPQSQDEEELLAVQAFGESDAKKYTEFNAAERKIHLLNIFSEGDVQQADLEKLCGKGFAQWSKKERITIIEAYVKLVDGADPSEIFG